jgi:sterol desaturase/sphingolipid hydroxylase (fatty acid hydroxylase superfamily)
MNKTKQKKRQGQIFANPFLETFTKAPPIVSVIIYLTILFSLLVIGYQAKVVSSPLNGVLIFAGAIFFWTFFEYFFHKYINHLDEYFPDSETARKVAYSIHGIHHEYPRDKERLIMPPVPGLIILAVLFLIFRLALGSYLYIFMPGFITGYLLYTFVHYSIHKTPVPSYLKVQYRHHAVHHYKYPNKAFGVSTTIWDRVFGTMPPKETG